MPSFSYIARTSEGTLERGTINAHSVDAAREQLRRKQMEVEELQEEDAPVTVQFANMPWTVSDEKPAKTPKSAPATSDAIEYIPLVDTLRLFAGWLLAWYAVVFLLGAYQLTGKLSSELPFLQSLFESWLVLRFACITFLFLLLTSIHRAWGRGIGKGLALAVIGVVLFVVFHVNA